jgi:hypothetical protein
VGDEHLYSRADPRRSAGRTACSPWQRAPPEFLDIFMGSAQHRYVVIFAAICPHIKIITTNSAIFSPESEILIVIHVESQLTLKLERFNSNIVFKIFC